MAKIDRLGWTAGLSFTAYGTRFGVRTNDASVLEQAQQYLPLGWEPSNSDIVDMVYSLKVGKQSQRKGTRHYNLLYAGAGLMSRSMALDELYVELESNLQLLTAYLAEGYLFVHAGAVGWQGRAIVIPGRSFVGKTTLVSTLVRAGATYYSDEFTVFDAEGRVHPYPLPLSIRDETGNNAQKHPVETLGGQAGREPLSVGLVVVTQYEAGAKWRPRTISPGRAVLALMDNAVAARKDPAFSLPTLQRAISGATALKSKRGEAVEMVGPLLGQLARA